MQAAVGAAGSSAADGLEVTTVQAFGAVCVSRSASARNDCTDVGAKLSFLSSTVTG
jgi:hypothetical protein